MKKRYSQDGERERERKREICNQNTIKMQDIPQSNTVNIDYYRIGSYKTLVIAKWLLGAVFFLTNKVYENFIINNQL